MTITKREFLTLMGGVAALGVPSMALAQTEVISVVATTGMIGDAAQAIGGPHVTLHTLMGPGVDPHAYRQTRSDVVKLAGADLVLWHGLYLEAQMEDLLLGLQRRTQVVAVAESIPQDQLLTHADYENRFDPHVWMNPDLWVQPVMAVRDALIAALPSAESTFRQNADAYLAKIAKIGTYAGKVLATVPDDARVLVTAHDAFGYFGAAYGFEVVGIQGISTNSEAGLNRVGQLVEMIVSRKIGAVFVESSVSERNIRALIEGAAAEGHQVRIGGQLYSDAMGPTGSYEGTYPGMIDHNVSVIASALGGQVPQRGMAGRLAVGL